MSQKAQFTWAGLIGSTIGGSIPMLWGASFLSMSSLIGNVVGGLVAIMIVYKLTSSL